MNLYDIVYRALNQIDLVNTGYLETEAIVKANRAAKIILSDIAYGSMIKKTDLVFDNHIAILPDDYYRAFYFFRDNAGLINKSTLKVQPYSEWLRNPSSITMSNNSIMRPSQGFNFPISMVYSSKNWLTDQNNKLLPELNEKSGASQLYDYSILINEDVYIMVLQIVILESKSLYEKADTVRKELISTVVQSQNRDSGVRGFSY